MSRPGGVPGGVVDDVRNVHSGKPYIISTAPEGGQDYWSTAVLEAVEKKRFFGLLRYTVPNPERMLVAFIRNTRDEAYEVHGAVAKVVQTMNEDLWFESFPNPEPPDGWSPDAGRKLNGFF